MRTVRSIIVCAVSAILCVGCATTELVNQFDVPSGRGATLANGGDIELFGGGAITEFMRYNGVNLVHGYLVAGKNARFAIPADTAHVDVRVNHMDSGFGRLQFAHAAFIFEAEEGVTYTVRAEPDAGGASISLVHSSRGVIAGPTRASWTVDQYAYSNDPAFQLDMSSSNSPGRTARCDELVGFWRMLPVSDSSVNEINPWPLPYQWFAFYADGQLVSMMQSEHADYSRAELQELFEPLRGSAQRYYCDEPWVVIQDASGGTPQIWGKNIFVRRAGEGNATPFEPGDIVLSLAAQDDRRMLYFRHLRRVK